MTTPDELEWRLQERVKELNLLHAATRLFQGSRLPLQVVLTELVMLLPPAWQYPDLCQARIRYGRTQATTPFWCESPWKLTTSFTTGDGRDGVVEVVYLQQTPNAAEGPFLAEERRLIDSLAELLAAWIERHKRLRKSKRGVTETDESRYEPQRIALLADLPAAIEQNQLTLHYQPKIDLRSGRTVEVEALVRWLHPEHGLIWPDRFVVLAESTQLVDALTSWVLTEALRQWHEWASQDLQLGLSLNLSARNLLDRTLGSRVVELARKAGLPLNLLTLEITESTIMADPARAQRVMSDLHMHGVRFTLEDCGIGQPSPRYLKDLPFSRMKVDKSLVMDFANARNAAIVRDAIALAHSHGMQITAEGVEDEATCAQVQELGCDYAQGYFFSRPLPEADLRAWLKEARWGSGG